MKSSILATIFAVLGSIACCSFPADAEACWFPFWPSTWGAGYRGTGYSGAGYGYSTPMLWYQGGYVQPGSGMGGGSQAGYGSFAGWSAPYSSDVYSAAYAGGNACCAPVLCDPCGTGCVGPGCVGPDCAPSRSGSDLLKPSADPNFQRRSDDLPDPLLEEPLRRDRMDPPGRRSPADDYLRDRDPLDDFSTPRTPRSLPDRGRTEDADWSPSGTRNPENSGTTDPGAGRRAPAVDDNFPPLGSPATGTGTGSDEDDGLFPTFESPGSQRSNKPPMTDPAEAEGEPDSLDEENSTDGNGQPSSTAPSGDDFLSPTETLIPLPAFPTTDQTLGNGGVRYTSQLREVLPRTRLAGDRTMHSSNAVSSQSKSLQTVSAPMAESVTGQSSVHTRNQRSKAPVRWISVPLPDSHVQL